MKDFIDDYISTISARRRERIYDVLADSQLHKKDVDALFEKLNEFRRQAPVVIKGEVPGNIVDAGKFDSVFRDVHIRLSELYRLSNDISALLFNNANILTSEIKALEDELVSVEKAIDNYAFGLADGGFYDYSFIETFSDEVMSETLQFTIPDRNGRDFTANEKASVNGASGVLTLSPGLSKSYGMAGVVSESNCLSYITSDTGIKNALNDSVGTGWRVAVSSPRPIISTLRKELPGGAQFYVELFLQNPSPSDTLILTPFSDIPVNVLSIRIFDNLVDNTFSEVLTQTAVLDRPTSFNFPLRSVSKVGILVAQPIYKRKATSVDSHENQYRTLVSAIQEDRKAYENIKNKPYKKNKRVHQYVFLRSQKSLHQFPGFFNSVSPTVDFDKASGPLTLDRMLFKRNRPNGNNTIWKESSVSQSLMKRMIFERAFAGNNAVLPKRSIIDRRSSFRGKETSVLNKNLYSYDGQGSLELVGSETAPSAFVTSVNSDQILSYEYDLGLRSISIGTGSSIYSGYYVSKVLPAPGDSGEVRLKVKDTNFAIVNSVRDSRIVTSVEYSITNRSTPTKESDWLPILPADESGVIAERLFVGQDGVAYFRFPASTQGGLTIYRNGFKIQIGDDNSYIYGSGKQSITGVRIPTGSVQLTDIFTCDYVPAVDASVINFEKIGFGQSVLASAYDSTGAGQTFSGTSSDRSISLSYEPYVDYDQVESVGVYDDNGFTGSYQPITIQMSDGTVAINQTNYKGFYQNSLADLADSSTIYYIHSGKNIIFNKVLDESFTVFYQYLPSNLRFRVVMRVNDPVFITPIVDSVQVKSKLRKADRRKVL